MSSHPVRSPADQVRGAPVTVALLVLIGIAFALELYSHAMDRPDLLGRFALSGWALSQGWYWTLVTHLFLHAGILHLLVNGLMLWFVGPEVERLLGPVRFLVLYFVSGIAGGLLQTAFSPPLSELVGASGAICGLILAFTTTYPELQLSVLLFFVVPVRMKARTLGYGLILVSLAFYLLGILPGFGHLAHLGGALAGWAMMRTFGYGRGFRPPRAPGGGPPMAARRDVDAVLRKLTEEGIESLSTEERRLLEGLTRGDRGRRER